MTGFFSKSHLYISIIVNIVLKEQYQSVHNVQILLGSHGKKIKGEDSIRKNKSEKERAPKKGGKI